MTRAARAEGKVLGHRGARCVALAAVVVAGCGDDGETSSGGGGGGGGTPATTSSQTSTASGSGGATSSGSTSSSGDASSSGDSSSGDSSSGDSSASASSSSSGGFVCSDPVAPETCATPEDDDCDGTECAIWGRSYAGVLRESVMSLAGTDQGDLYFIGDLVDRASSIEFGGETVSADASHTMFLAKVSATGEELWIRLLPTDGVFASYQIVTTSDGGVVLSRWLEETADLGGGPITPVGDQDVAFVRYDADGDHHWQKVLTTGEGGFGRVWSYGRGPSGDIVYFGDATPGATYDGAVVTSAVSDRPQSIFSLEIDPSDGAFQWSHELPIGELDQEELTVSHPTFDAQGNFAIAGTYVGDETDFGSGPLPYEGDPYEGYVARFDADGEPLSSTRVCEGNCYIYAAASTPSGELHFSAVARAPSTLGGEVEVDFIQAFIVKLTSDDELVWALPYTTPTPSNGLWLAELGLQANGDLTFAIPYQDRLDFEPGTLDPATFEAEGDYDILVGKLDPDGDTRWVRSFGSPGSYVEKAYDGRSIAVTADGQFTLAFTFVSSGLDFGSGPLLSSQMTDMALIHLAP